ncbi:MAG: EF-P lysine aminoacylase EpmA [bacterium]|nr:EF-P lysine aminoacylase GenX [Gammaproteobacteria bacterium]HIL94756.1 EF-P lysine aminoacylase GenX [Pseudomonadales bacterium]
MSGQSQVRLLQDRARLMRLVRAFFTARSVLEVTTPSLGSRGATDPHIESMRVKQGNQAYFLQTSPEFAMKRLLAYGSGAIFQICPAFRGGESGAHHNPEFTMLEWYRPGMGLVELMDEVKDLITGLCREFEQVFEPVESGTYRSLFEHQYSVNPHRVSSQQLLEITHSKLPGFAGNAYNEENYEDEGVIDDLLGLLFSRGIEPGLLDPQFVTEFPATQASLSKVGQVAGDQVALRFELYWQGLELANGYDELTDPTELTRRIARDNRIRESRGLPMMLSDQRLLAAMAEMPTCTGVAIGLDRLLMLLTDKESIQEVLSFGIEDC